MDEKVIVVYSGGMDSYTILHKTICDGFEVKALTFDYGQKHKKEIDYARRVCEGLDIIHKVIDITAVHQLMAGSALTSGIEVPEGHYTDKNMKSTVVPNRNMILLSLAVGYAVSMNASKVFYGAHAGDHEIYPDCRPEFVKKMNAVCAVANYEAVEIVTPYLALNKVDILNEGLEMGLDYVDTWTCYNGREKSCGKCGSCVERLEAFASTQVPDPLAYEDLM
jgi:7-cyano-7-deazaguanine synthase